MEKQVLLDENPLSSCRYTQEFHQKSTHENGSFKKEDGAVEKDQSQASLDLKPWKRWKTRQVVPAMVLICGGFFAVSVIKYSFFDIRYFNSTKKLLVRSYVLAHLFGCLLTG